MLKDFSKEHYDIIIQAGQSNSEGCGLGKTDLPYVPNDRVWYMNGGILLSHAHVNSVNGNEIQSTYVLEFARLYMEKGYLTDGRKLFDLKSLLSEEPDLQITTGEKTMTYICV